MKLRTQKLQSTTKRNNKDITLSTKITPVKQRRVLNNVVDTMKAANATENLLSYSLLKGNTSIGFQNSTMVKKKTMNFFSIDFSMFELFACFLFR